MKLKNHHLVYGALAVILLWLLYLVRSAVMPFVLAAAFAYLLNPLVSILTHRVRIPRDLSISVIYLVLISSLFTVIVIGGNGLAAESEQFANEARVLVQEANNLIAALPEWLRPLAADSFESARTSLLYPQGRIAAFLPGAVNRTISLLVFLVASFYFLRDGHRFIGKFFAFFPLHIAREIEEVAGKINVVLGNYLRGQLYLMIIMGTAYYIGLSILGVRYALILSIFAGLAEVIPYFGPIIAALIAMSVAFLDQVSRFNLAPMLDVAAVGALYFVLNQLENLFIVPQLMGRLTKLHPLLIMFAVLAGGHLFGLLGYLVAVPVFASAKVVLDHITKKAL